MWIVLVFVIGMLVVFAGGYQLAEKKALTPKKRYDKIMESASGHDYACEALVTRVFEQRLVEAGIMTVEEMSTCDSPACKDCLPTPQAKPRRLQQDHKEAEAKRKFRLPAPGSRKVLKIAENGRHKREIPWPESVPEFANIRFEDDSYRNHTKRLVFTWTDPDDGRTYSKTMLVPILTGIEATFTDGGNPVWTPPTHAGSDPVHKRMAGKSRYDAIAELRENPRRPPKGRGAGSPIKGNPQTY